MTVHGYDFLQYTLTHISMLLHLTSDADFKNCRTHAYISKYHSITILTLSYTSRFNF